MISAPTPLSSSSFPGTFDLHSSLSVGRARAVAARSRRWRAGVWSSRPRRALGAGCGGALFGLNRVVFLIFHELVLLTGDNSVFRFHTLPVTSCLRVLYVLLVGSFSM
jgi:hypothetical protein